MKKRIQPWKVLLFALILCLCACGNETYFEGTIVEITDETVTVAPFETDEIYSQAAEIIFDASPEESRDYTVGEDVGVLFQGKPGRGTPAKVDVIGWGPANRTMTAAILEIGEGTLLVSPLPEEPLARETDVIRFVDGDPGFSAAQLRPGDVISVTYVRDLIPGDPPALDVQGYSLVMMKAKADAFRTFGFDPGAYEVTDPMIGDHVTYEEYMAMWDIIGGREGDTHPGFFWEEESQTLYVVTENREEESFRLYTLRRAPGTEELWIQLGEVRTLP